MISVTDIIWETDGEKVDYLPKSEKISFEDLDLPEECANEVCFIEEAIADYLSDMYGWLVDSFWWHKEAE